MFKSVVGLTTINRNGDEMRNNKRMTEQPKEITVVKLECVLMPQGELISKGKTIGWFKDLKEFLTVNEQ